MVTLTYVDPEGVTQTVDLTGLWFELHLDRALLSRLPIEHMLVIAAAELAAGFGRTQIVPVVQTADSRTLRVEIAQSDAPFS